MDIAKLLNGDQVSASIPPKETRPVREVKCPKCNKSVLSTNLNRHVKTQHQTPHDARPFTCEKTHCKRKFHFKSAAKEHYRIVHSHDKPHRCEQCNKSFGEKSNLTKHLATRKHRTQPIGRRESSTKGRL